MSVLSLKLILVHVILKPLILDFKHIKVAELPVNCMIHLSLKSVEIAKLIIVLLFFITIFMDQKQLCKKV